MCRSSARTSVRPRACPARLTDVRLCDERTCAGPRWRSRWAAYAGLLMQFRKNPEEPGSALCVVRRRSRAHHQKRWRSCGAGDARCDRSAGTGQRPVKRAWRRSAKLRRPSAASSLARSPGSSDAMRSRAASGPWPSPARALASVACTPRWACRATSWASSLARPMCAPVPGERSKWPANAGERTGSRWSGPGRQICCSRARSRRAHSHLAAAARSARQPASTLTTSTRTP